MKRQNTTDSNREYLNKFNTIWFNEQILPPMPVPFF